MKNHSVWAIVVLVALVAGALVATQLSAQRPQPGPGIAPYMPVQPGRFVVVKVDGKNIILLDSATGDLYKAGEDDIKKYSARPKIGVMPGPWGPPIFREKKIDDFPRKKI